MPTRPRLNPRSLVGERTAIDDPSLHHVCRCPIQHERDAALTRYLHDRDTRALEQAMARLDAEEAEERASTQAAGPSEALEWLRDLPALWEAADDSGRRLL